MNTDPISDMLTRIRNAIAVKKGEVKVPASQVKEAIAKILEREGFLSSVKRQGEGVSAELLLTIAYDASRPKIHDLKRVSKPGQRVYAKADELPRVMSGLGIAIVSTPNGLMTNKEARARRLGGEVICEVF
jgi:small subunit ribosomal protein S8